MVRVRGIVDVVATAIARAGLTALDRWMRDFIVVSNVFLDAAASVYSCI